MGTSCAAAVFRFVLPRSAPVSDGRFRTAMAAIAGVYEVCNGVNGCSWGMGRMSESWGGWGGWGLGDEGLSRARESPPRYVAPEDGVGGLRTRRRVVCQIVSLRPKT